MKRGYRLIGLCGAALALVGCVPRIEVAAPKEPITINMNVKIEHDIHIRADKDAAQLLEKSANATGEEMKNASESTGEGGAGSAE